MSLRKYSVRFALLGLVMAGAALAAPSALARGHVSFGLNIGVPVYGGYYPAAPVYYEPAYYPAYDYYPAYPTYGSVYYYGGYGRPYYRHGYYRGGHGYYGHRDYYHGGGYYHRGH